MQNHKPYKKPSFELYHNIYVQNEDVVSRYKCRVAVLTYLLLS